MWKASALTRLWNHPEEVVGAREQPIAAG